MIEIIAEFLKEASLKSGFEMKFKPTNISKDKMSGAAIMLFSKLQIKTEMVKWTDGNFLIIV